MCVCVCVLIRTGRTLHATTLWDPVPALFRAQIELHPSMLCTEWCDVHVWVGELAQHRWEGADGATLSVVDLSWCPMLRFACVLLSCVRMSHGWWYPLTRRLISAYQGQGRACRATLAQRRQPLGPEHG